MTIPESLDTLTPLAVLCSLLYLAAAARVLWYRPNGARHRYAVSFFASLLLAALTCRGLEIALRGGASYSELALAGLILAATVAAGGNVAVFFRGYRNG